MFAYSPTPDRSGEIIAAGQMQAANTQAQMYNQLGQDIGGALANIGNMYGEIEGRKAKGRAFKKTLEVLGPSIGMTTDKLKAAFGDLKNDMDYYNASEMLMPVMPALINAQLVQGNIGVKRDQQALTAAMPTITAGARAEADVAAGQAPYRPANRPRGIIPAATSQPMPVVTQAPAPDLRNIQRPFRNY